MRVAASSYPREWGYKESNFEVTPAYRTRHQFACMHVVFKRLGGR